MVNEILSKSLISQGRMVLENHKKIDKVIGGAFNVFSIMKLERRELTMHSNFLFELLNPKGSHSQGDLYLKAFVHDVLGIQDFNYERVVAEQERSVGDLGRIDLVIESAEVLLLIEIKIDAGDQKDQLKRYEAYGKTRKKELQLFYLTLDGKQASEWSDPEGDVSYKCISFESDIKEWIEKCIRLDRTPHLSGIREILLQYLRVIEKITGQLEGGLKMELKDLLLKSDNLAIAENLSKAIPYAKAELELKFWKALNAKLMEHFEVLEIKCADTDFFQSKDAIEDIVDIRKNKKGILCITYMMKASGEVEFLFELGSSGYSPTIYAAISIEESGESLTVDKWNDEFLKKVERAGLSELTDEDDVMWDFLDSEINFHSDLIYKLLSREIFDEVVEKVSGEILEIASRLMNREI
jgi:hypothetical protein